MVSALFYLYSLDWSISNRKGVRLVSVVVCFIKMHVRVFYVAPRSAAFDLDLYCLLLSLFRTLGINA